MHRQNETAESLSAPEKNTAILVERFRLLAKGGQSSITVLSANTLIRKIGMMWISRIWIRKAIRFSASSFRSLMNGLKMTQDHQESSGIPPRGYMTVCVNKPDIQAVTAALSDMSERSVIYSSRELSAVCRLLIRWHLHRWISESSGAMTQRESSTKRMRL